MKRERGFPLATPVLLLYQEQGEHRQRGAIACRLRKGRIDIVSSEPLPLASHVAIRFQSSIEWDDSGFFFDGIVRLCGAFTERNQALHLMSVRVIRPRVSSGMLGLLGKERLRAIAH